LLCNDFRTIISLLSVRERSLMHEGHFIVIVHETWWSRQRCHGKKYILHLSKVENKSTPDNRFPTFLRLRQVLPIPEVMFVHIREAIIYFKGDNSLEYEL
jgi:hypothetical protein